MLTQICHCHACSGTNLFKNGTNASGSQLYKCKDYGTCCVLNPQHKSTQVDKESVLRTSEERSSYRSTVQMFKIGYTTVCNW